MIRIPSFGAFVSGAALAAAVWGADSARPDVAASSAWSKVSELRPGTEIRLYRSGVKQPLTATVDEAGEEKLIIVLRDQQLAVPKEEIDRVDARPGGSKARLTRESRTSVVHPDTRPPGVGPARAPAVPSTTSSTGVTVNGKPDFETVYRRTGAAERK